MTDYNDGKWHGWNGGARPVHEKTHVDVCDPVSAPRKNVSAGSDVYWPNVIAFRVIEEYREPREWWIDMGDLRAYADHDKAKSVACGQLIRVCEVLE